MARSRRTLTVLGVVVVVVAAGAFAAWWFLIRDDAPPPASIDDASQTLDESGGGSHSDSVDVSGDWTVDDTIGSFDDFSGTWAGYRFDEELGGIGANTAVGRTPDVTGTMTVEGGEVTAVDVDVNMSTLQSDDDRRDNAIRGRGLETDTFPTGTFTLTEPLDLPDGVDSGEQVSATATGELTLHGTTRPVTVDLQATVDGDSAVVVGEAPVSMSDYGITPPTNAFVLSVDDQGAFEFQIFFTKA